MIKKIKWNNHVILKNLELDLCKDDGTPYNTIVLAGENGVGKTTILETLADFLNRESFEPFDYIQYCINDVEYTDKKIVNRDTQVASAHIRKNGVDGTEKEIRSNKTIMSKQIEEDLTDIRHYGVAYSKARSGFKTTAVKSSTIQQLDNEKYATDNNEDFTSIKQLLVDIQDQDNEMWREISDAHPGALLCDYEDSFNITRFKKAFNQFFQNLQFEKIDLTDPNEKKVIFKKHQNNIAIDQLSTGEKQIVFRGAYLLKNSECLSEGIVLIDEPELSMHPKWQQNVLQYYRGLYTQNETQSVQMIFATHSEFVLKAALEDRENVLIIALYDQDGTITAKYITAPTSLPSVTFAETNYLVFDMISNDYHIELYEYLKNKFHFQYVKKFDTYISTHPAYDSSIHAYPTQYKSIKYVTLPTYIRNEIDHPKIGRTYTDEQLRCSIELLIKMC